jgi:bifunctional UDP-N-acetylglucosamine pyrophosphorylase/glucosamine-1-phosphate N-acetyltransferase
MGTTAIILAAGRGTRMKTALPKVLHPVCNQPMLTYVFDACREVGCDRLLCVIGFGAEKIRATYADQKDVTWVEQTQPRGTGHAVQVCKPCLGAEDGELLVLAGDGPLVQAETLRQLLAVHRRRRSACTLASSIMANPGSFGRVIRDETGEMIGVVEYLDATEAQHQIKEVNVSLYCFDAARLLAVIDDLRNDNAKGEYYLTDTLGMLRARGYPLAGVPTVPPEDVLSINDRVQLAEVSRLMQERIQRRHMLAGVTIEDPASTWIDPRASVGPDTTIRPTTVVDGRCRIGRRCVIGPMVHLRDAVVKDDQIVEHSHG